MSSDHPHGGSNPTDVRALIPPAIILEELAITERTSNAVSNARAAAAAALAEYALSQTKAVVPVLLDDTPLAEALAPLHGIGRTARRSKRRVPRLPPRRSSAVSQALVAVKRRGATSA